MRVLKPLQTGVLQKPFSYNERHFLCVSLLWAFRMDSGGVVLEGELWEALSGFLKEGRIFDQSMPKDRGEFLCAGSFHAPRGEPVRQEAVSVRVGRKIVLLDLRADGHHSAVDLGAAGLEQITAGRPLNLIPRHGDLVRRISPDFGDVGHRRPAREHPAGGDDHGFLVDDPLALAVPAGDESGV